MITELARVARKKDANDSDKIRAATAIMDRAGLGPNSRVEVDTPQYEGFLAAVVRKGGTVERGSRYDRRTVPIEDDDEDDTEAGR